MYQSLTHFLQTFSVEHSLLWALLVMAVIASAGLLLYGFWELLLRGLGRVIAAGRRAGPGNATGSGHGPGSRHGGH